MKNYQRSDKKYLGKTNYKSGPKKLHNGGLLAEGRNKP